MKIKYEFVTETQEIEVSEEWAAVLAELDRQEYNNDQRESRRHCSLEAYDPEGERVAAGDDLEDDIMALIDSERLRTAISTLEPQQQELVRRVYFDGEKIVSIAASEHVSEAAIRDRLKKIYARMKKILKNF